MIDFNQFPMHKKPYADNTLRCMPRKELIAYIRDIEHNYETLYWFYQNAVNANLEKFKDFERVVRCRDCKHRPRRIEKNGGNWFDLEFPDNRCPAQDDDGRYNWMPDDNWYCGNAERKE